MNLNLESLIIANNMVVKCVFTFSGGKINWATCNNCIAIGDTDTHCGTLYNTTTTHSLAQGPILVYSIHISLVYDSIADPEDVQENTHTPNFTSVYSELQGKLRISFDFKLLIEK